MPSPRVPADVFGPYVPSRPPQHLGDMLQRLAVIAPDTIHLLRRLVQRVLRQEERRYRLRFKLPPRA